MYKTNKQSLKIFSMVIIIALLSSFAAMAMSGDNSAVLTAGNTKLSDVIKENTERHDTYPHGRDPSWELSQGPMIWFGNTPPDGWGYVVISGQAYVPADGSNTSTNTAISVRNPCIYVFSKSKQQWFLMTNQYTATAPGLDGFFYDENYVGNIPYPLELSPNHIPDGNLTARPY